MERNRLICVRIPLDVLDLIDKEAAKHRYMNRSFVINRVLECMMGKRGALQWRFFLGTEHF